MSLKDALKTLARLAYHATRSKVDRRHRLKWTTEFTQSTAIMPRDTLDEDALADALIELADHSNYSETELADAVFYFSSAGLDEDIPIQLENAVLLADVALCDLSTAADGIATLSAIFDLGADDSYRASGSITRVIRSTPMTPSDAIHVFERVGSVAIHLDKTPEGVAGDIIHASRDPELHHPSDAPGFDGELTPDGKPAGFDEYWRGLIDAVEGDR